MALVKCPDCGRDVSQRAPTCPGCGAPIANAPSAAPAYQAVQAIEETGKRWKRLQVYGVIEILAATGPLFIRPRDNPEVGPIALLWIMGLLGLGLATLAYARIGAWWHHR